MNSIVLPVISQLKKHLKTVNMNLLGTLTLQWSCLGDMEFESYEGVERKIQI